MKSLILASLVIWTNTVHYAVSASWKKYSHWLLIFHL